MGTVDEAFLQAGKTTGLEIWRIEKLKVVQQDPATYGEFYSGDSYIVLHTKKNVNSNAFEWNVHFWLGKETSQDEKGVAAYKTVELDDYLGGAPVQHREVQDHESKLFLSYFSKGIRYLTGGIESGFRKVEKGKFVKRLFQIKGKKNVRVRQVECCCKSLNKGDVFLLDCGYTLHLWNGPQSSTFERMKGHQVAKTIRDEERGGKAEIRIIDQRWNSDIQFFADLGSKDEIAESSREEDDTEFEKRMISEIKLYRVSDESGKIQIEEKSKKPFQQSDLDSNDCFILDSGQSGIYVWIGRKCTAEEKRSAWTLATDFLEMKGYPNWTSVTRLVDGGETPVFKQFFLSWVDENDQKGLGVVHNVGSIAEIKHNGPIDYCKLHERQQSKEEEPTGLEAEEIKIWKIVNGDAKPQKLDEYIVLSSTSCYVFIISCKSEDKHITYGFYWQGASSTLDDRTASAIYAKRLCEGQKGKDVHQVRVDQGKEPGSLMKLLNGKLIVTLKNDTVDTNRMFHIRGTCLENTKTIEVEFGAKSLNSYDVFLVLSECTVYMWVGKVATDLVAALSLSNKGPLKIPKKPDILFRSSHYVHKATGMCAPSSWMGQPVRMDVLIRMAVDAEIEAARQLALYLQPKKTITCFNEDKETNEFWKALGGKVPYAMGTRPKDDDFGDQDFVRLFACSNTTGMFKVTEIANFTQQDLLEDDVMLLDTFDEIYVWVGKGANQLERQKSLETAVKYLKSDPFGRTEQNTKLKQIRQGYEPSTFTSHFHGWDHSRWRSSLYKRDSMENILSSNQITTVQEELQKFDQCYTYQQLLQKRLPDGVDSTCKEKYLSNADFLDVFGISKEMFYSKPKWKQLELKKKVSLF